jgi:hypothetical protein
VALGGLKKEGSREGLDLLCFSVPEIREREGLFLLLLPLRILYIV